MPTLQLLPLDDTLVGGRYQLGEVIGSGGAGIVYRATHLWTEREVAVKVLDPCLPHFDQLREAFLREARATVQLQHPHVVDILDMGEDEAGNTYLVMELLHGPTLRDILVEQGSLSAEDTAGILLPLIGALEKAHELGIVHKDFKPENIILSVDSHGAVTPKLLDFGVAQMVRDSRPHPVASVEDVIVGTPRYMAPEQARDQRDLVGPQTDVWGVGVVWYECLAGHNPFEGEMPEEVLRAVCETPIDFKTIPDKHAEVLQWALERSVAKRIPSLWILRAEFERTGALAGPSHDFRGAASTQQSSAERPSDVRRILQEAAISQPTEVKESSARVDDELPDLPTRSRGRPTLAAVALLIAMGFAAWWTVANLGTDMPASPSSTESVVEPEAPSLEPPEPLAGSAGPTDDEASDSIDSAFAPGASGPERTSEDPSEDTEENSPTEPAAEPSPAKTASPKGSPEPRGAVRSRRRQPSRPSDLTPPKPVTEW